MAMGSGKRGALFGAALLALAACLLPSVRPPRADAPGSGGGAAREAGMATRRWPAMSTFAEFSTRDGPGRRDAQAEIVREALAEVERELSVFNPESAVSKLNAEGTATLPVVDDPARCSVLAVLAFSLEAARASGGAFDPTVNPLMRLWGFRRGGAVAEPPSREALDGALARVGHGHVSVVTNGDGTATVSFDAPGVQLDLGAVAKGYAVDLAYERLVRAGASDFLVNLGGNIRVHGRPGPGRDAWRIAVRDPADPARTTGEVVELRGGEAVATSGSYERYVVIGGRRHSHILDPRTGRPVERGGFVTVVAPSAMEADALSTAGFVLGDEGVTRAARGYRR